MSVEVFEENGYEQRSVDDIAQCFATDIKRWLKQHKGNERWTSVLHDADMHCQITLTIRHDPA